MNILSETLSPQVHLESLAISTKYARTVADGIEAILARRNTSKDNPSGKTWAEQQLPSVNLPLRILLRQQTFLPGDEVSSTERLRKAMKDLVGEIALVGFQNEEEVVTLLEHALSREDYQARGEEKELLAA